MILKWIKSLFCKRNKISSCNSCNKIHLSEYDRNVCNDWNKILLNNKKVPPEDKTFINKSEHCD